MRKRLITTVPQGIQSRHEGWLDLDRAASVEVASEEKDYEIEAALVTLQRGNPDGLFFVKGS